MPVQTSISKVNERYHGNSREPNVNSERINYVNYITVYTKTVLSIYGIWPIKTMKLARNIYDSSIAIFLYLLIGFVFSSAIINIILDTNNHRRLKKAPLVFILADVIMKYSISIIRKKELRSCLTVLEEDWKRFLNFRNLMIKCAKLSRRFIMFVIIINFSCVLTNRIVAPMHFRKIAMRLNVTLRPLPYPVYLFSVDTQVTPVYEILYTIHCMAGVVIASLSTAEQGLAAALILHGCAQLKILLNLLLSFIEKQWKTDANVTKKLASLVEFQVRVYRYIELVNISIGPQVLVQIFLGTAVICVGTYGMLTEKADTVTVGIYLFVVTVLLVNMFTLFYVGDLLLSESENIIIASCSLEWYRLPMKEARSMILVILRSSSPPKITPGNIFELSLRTYISLLKAAVAYCNIFRATVT